VLASALWKRLHALTFHVAHTKPHTTIMQHRTTLGHRRIAQFRLQSFYYRPSVVFHPTHRDSTIGGRGTVYEDIKFWQDQLEYSSPTTTSPTTYQLYSPVCSNQLSDPRTVSGNNVITDFRTLPRVTVSTTAASCSVSV